jgi:hypothetical protein
MKEIVCSVWCVAGTVTLAFAQVAPIPPDTLSKKLVTGRFIWAQGSFYTELDVKRNNSCSWKKKNYGKTQEQKGNWEIKNDTLFISAEGSPSKDKLVMHDGKLFLLPKSGSGQPQPGMTKSDYKFYQKQCKESGH